jgi:hypothetical protein
MYRTGTILSLLHPINLVRILVVEVGINEYRVINISPYVRERGYEFTIGASKLDGYVVISEALCDAVGTGGD